MPDPVTAVVSAGIGAVGSVIGAGKTAKAAGKASDAQLQAAREAEALNRERYGIATDLLTPYIEDSGTARDQLMVELGLAEGEAGTAYLDTPGYQAMLTETREGVDQASANSGNLYSGRRGEAAGEASAGVQQSFYNNYMNLLTNMSSPTTATNLASMGVGQGIAMGQQNLSAQQIAGGYNVSAAQTNQAAFGDIVGAGANIYSGYLAGSTPPPTSYVDPASIPVDQFI